MMNQLKIIAKRHIPLLPPPIAEALRAAASAPAAYPPEPRKVCHDYHQS